MRRTSKRTIRNRKSVWTKSAKEFRRVAAAEIQLMLMMCVMPFTLLRIIWQCSSSSKLERLLNSQPPLLPAHFLRSCRFGSSAFWPRCASASSSPSSAVTRVCLAALFVAAHVYSAQSLVNAAIFRNHAEGAVFALFAFGNKINNNYKDNDTEDIKNNTTATTIRANKDNIRHLCGSFSHTRFVFT